MVIGRMKRIKGIGRKTIGIICLCTALNGTQALAAFGGAEYRRAEYAAALAALWSLDQSDVSEEALIEIARAASGEREAKVKAYTFSGSEADNEESEYARLAIAHVNDYVNVRSLPSTDGKVLGKIYNGAVAEILETAGENDEWFHVTSGSVEGYIKAEYFIYGDAAAEVIDDYVTRTVQVDANLLNVRREADITSSREGYLNRGEKVPFLENCGEWIKVQYAENKERYVAAEYVTIIEEFTYAKSIEEERAEKQALLALQQRKKTSEDSVPENITVTPPDTSYTTNTELRTEIVNYAMQFLGNKYVSGGNSLTKGTDCSGFTSLIYKDFGYSIGRTPSGQYSSAGRSISYSEIQPGDIICYSSNGRNCTHVALYIGNGQIIHAANARKGIVIYDAGYDTIIGVKNVID